MTILVYQAHTSPVTSTHRLCHCGGRRLALISRSATKHSHQAVVVDHVMEIHMQMKRDQREISASHSHCLKTGRDRLWLIRIWLIDWQRFIAASRGNCGQRETRISCCQSSKAVLLVFSIGEFIIKLKCERNFPHESFPRILFRSPLGITYILFKQESVYVEKEKLAAFK